MSETTPGSVPLGSPRVSLRKDDDVLEAAPDVAPARAPVDVDVPAAAEPAATA
ncbi:MAG: hypothetical protein JWM64_2365, partial [Frankiales bacterium]|nr:hypothetical protein [Frankiales bacterium]